MRQGEAGSVKVRSWPASLVPAELRAQVVALQEQAWPSDDPAAAQGVAHDPALRPVSLLLVDDGTVVAALDILSKVVIHRGRRFAASGLSTVVTDRERRRQGHGRRLVTAAGDALRDGGADLGIFSCDRPLRPFYESAGWCVLPGAVLVGGTPKEPFPSDRLDKVVLARFFSARARSCAGWFDRARIELFPGPIDKLW
jgi:GNAT superfamily N-acetyltransferase